MKIINYEKNEMILPTDEENKSYEKQKVCYISKIEFNTDEFDIDENDKNEFKEILRPVFCIVVTGNGKLCKIYFKKLFFQNVLASIDLFHRYHYIGYFIYSDCIWRHAHNSTEVASWGIL